MGKGRFVSLSVFNRAHAGAESEESLYSVLSWRVSKSVNEIFMVLLDLITLWKFKEERQVSLQNKINRLKIGPARRTSLDMRVVKVSGLEKIIAISKPERTRAQRLRQETDELSKLISHAHYREAFVLRCDAMCGWHLDSIVQSWRKRNRRGGNRVFASLLPRCARMVGKHFCQFVRVRTLWHHRDYWRDCSCCSQNPLW